jgi:CRP/FNR family cyclic AMP-dependent transcriptional regulator
MENVELMKRIRIFEGLTPEELSQFAAMTAEQSFPFQTIIVEEATEGRALYIVKRGTVSVTKIDGETETEIVKLVAGEAFGEMSLIEHSVTSARVTAYNDVQCLVIGWQDFFNLLDQNVAIAAKVYKNFTRILSERLRQTSSELVTWKPDMNL